MISRSPSSNKVISALTKTLLSISIATVSFCSSYAATTDFGLGDKASSPAASRFVLQLGQFDDEAAAKQSVDKLGTVGVHAYLENQPQSDGSTRTLLRAGPFPDRSSASAALVVIRQSGVYLGGKANATQPGANALRAAAMADSRPTESSSTSDKSPSKTARGDFSSDLYGGWSCSNHHFMYFAKNKKLVIQTFSDTRSIGFYEAKNGFVLSTDVADQERLDGHWKKSAYPGAVAVNEFKKIDVTHFGITFKEMRARGQTIANQNPTEITCTREPQVSNLLGPFVDE